MKNSEKCPKCGGTDIVYIDGGVQAYGGGNNITLGGNRCSAIGVTRYVCCDCGFTEEWIDLEDLENVKNSKKAKHQN